MNVTRIMNFSSHGMILEIIKKIYALGEATERNWLSLTTCAFEEAGRCIESFYH
jgi:hypothetical protein